MPLFTPQSRRRAAALDLASRIDLDDDTRKLLIDRVTSRDSAFALSTDRVIYRIVVAGLSAIALVSLVASLWLALIAGPETTITRPDGTTEVTGGLVPPEIFLALGSVAVGALAGLLAPSPAQSVAAKESR